MTPSFASARAVAAGHDRDAKTSLGTRHLAAACSERAQVAREPGRERRRPLALLPREPIGFEVEFTPPLLDDGVEQLEGPVGGRLHRRVQDRAEARREGPGVAAELTNRPVQSAFLEGLDAGR